MDDGEGQKITAADAVRIAKQMSAHQGKRKREPYVQLLSFRECYKMARDNIHGNPDLQGPIAFGDLDNLDREGACWFISAQYGNWSEITFIDEVGNAIYQFNR